MRTRGILSLFYLGAKGSKSITTAHRGGMGEDSMHNSKAEIIGMFTEERGYRRCPIVGCI